MWVHAPQLLSFLYSEIRIVASTPWGCVSTRLRAFALGTAWHSMAVIIITEEGGLPHSDQELSFGRCPSRLSTSSLWRTKLLALAWHT